MDGDSFEELLDRKDAAHRALQQRLAVALDELAADYVNVHGRKIGMEEMCDDFFRRAALKHYPDGGWSGLLQYALKMAG
jgi:hypothetical protein